MSSRKLILAIVTVLVIVTAWKIDRDQAPTTEIASTQLYPELIEQLNDVQHVAIETVRRSIELAKTEDGWVVGNRDNFPARFSTIKNMLMNLAELTIVEKKTSKPENYAQLAVDGMDKEDSESILIRLDHRDGAELASLIIGNERSGSRLDSPNYYVRKSGEASALLVQGDLNISPDPQEWMETDIVDVTTERVRQVRINRNLGTPIIVSKEKPGEDFFTLQAIPTGFTEKSRAVISSLGALLQGVKFDDVMAAHKAEGALSRTIVEIQTFDGLVANLEQIDFKDKVYVQFRFEFNPDTVVPLEEDGTEDSGERDAGKAGSPPSVADEVTELNARVAGWVYVLPDYKMRMLDKRFEDMIKPAEPAPQDTAKTGSE